VPGDAILDELAWRGLTAQSTDLDALRGDLAAAPMTVYAGFDPTADSLHVGNLMPLLTLRRFQLAGHRPIALAGGATGFIGDPSGRSSERTLMDAETVRSRVERIRLQLGRFLDFDGSAAAVLVDNLDWIGPLTAIEFLRDVGKHFPVNIMLQKESVSARLAGGGLTFTEFSYMLLQAHDYLQLFRRRGCRLQVGGADQWGNLTAGLDLIRRVEGPKAASTAHALTVPLVTSASGEKFGKSTGAGSLWLDPQLTSPYALYQYFLGTDDRDVGSYVRYLTFLSREEVEALDAETEQRPQTRQAQRKLAEQVVSLVHGPVQMQRAAAAGAALFGGAGLRELDEPTLRDAVAQAPSVRTSAAAPLLVDLLAEGLGLSRSDARRAVRDGGAYLNNVRVLDDAAVLGPGDWLHGRFAVLRRGKRALAVAERTG